MKVGDLVKMWNKPKKFKFGLITATMQLDKNNWALVRWHNSHADWYREARIEVISESR